MERSSHGREEEAGAAAMAAGGPVEEDELMDDEEIPDYVMEYLQSEQGRLDENIPEHILAYIQRRAAALERNRKEQPVAFDDDLVYTEEELRILDEARRKLSEQGEHFEMPRLTLQAHSIGAAAAAADGDGERPRRQGEHLEQFFQRAALDTEAAESALVEAGGGRRTSDCVVVDVRKKELATKRKASCLKRTPSALTAQSAASAPGESSKLKVGSGFDLRSISMPRLGELKMPKFLEKIGSKIRSVSAREVGATGAKARRTHSISPVRQRIRDELEQQMEQWNRRRVVEKKFSLSDFKIRSRRSRQRDAGDDEEEPASRQRRRNESISPLRRKIREELEVWNSRGVVEKKFNLSDYTSRGRKREKTPTQGAEDAASTKSARHGSLSPIRQKIREEIEAWNTRTVVETKFKMSDFKPRRRSKTPTTTGSESALSTQSAESVGPIRQLINEQLDAWNSRGVVETKFKMDDFRGRKRDKTPTKSEAGDDAESEGKRSNNFSPIRQKITEKINEQLDAWNSRGVVETKFKMDDFRGRKRDKTPTKSEAGDDVEGQGKRSENVSPIRQKIADKINQELEAWNSREIVETKFKMDDFRGRKRDKTPTKSEAGDDVEGEGKRSENVSPIRQKISDKISQELDAWNNREVVETKFKMDSFRGRKRDKTPTKSEAGDDVEDEGKRSENTSPIRQKIADKISQELDAWNNREVVETKFRMESFRGRKRDKTPTKSEEGDDDEGEGKRSENTSPIRQKITDKISQELDAWNNRGVVETKFRMDSFRGRKREKTPTKSESGDDVEDEGKRSENVNPIRQKISDKISQELDAWNSRGVVETKFKMDSFRGRKREKTPVEDQTGDDADGEGKRSKNISPIRQKIAEKISQEIDAWNTRGVVETKFKMDEFKGRGRKNEKEPAEESRSDHVSPIREKIKQEIHQEIEGWKSRGVVESKFNLSDFKFRSKKDTYRDGQVKGEIFSNLYLM